MILTHRSLCNFKRRCPLPACGFSASSKLSLGVLRASREIQIFNSLSQPSFEAIQSHSPLKCLHLTQLIC